MRLKWLWAVSMRSVLPQRTKRWSSHDITMRCWQSDAQTRVGREPGRSMGWVGWVWLSVGWVGLNKIDPRGHGQLWTNLIGRQVRLLLLSCRQSQQNGPPGTSGVRQVCRRCRIRNWKVVVKRSLEQAANLLCAQTNPASYPQWIGKWQVAEGLRRRPRVADWGGGMSACVLPRRV